MRRDVGQACVWCLWTVVDDGQGGWTHIDGFYACRDKQGTTLLGRYAFPRTPRWPLVTSGDHPGSGGPLTPCANCAESIVRDGRGGWIHPDRSYACRDHTHVLTGKYATPAGT